MGTWSADMFGSDHALDTLSVLEEVIGFSGPEPDDDSLYPLPSPKDREKKVKIVDCLIKSERAVLANKWFATEKAWHIVSCIYMSVGVPLPNLLKIRAIQCCKDEIDDIPNVGWSDEGMERERILYSLITDLENYTGGQAISIPHTGLFEKLDPKPVETVNTPQDKENNVKKIEYIDATQAENILLELALQKAEIKATKKLKKKLEKLRNKHRKHTEKKINKLANMFPPNNVKYQISGPWNKKD